MPIYTDTNLIIIPRKILFVDRECPEIAQPEIGTVTISGREFGGRAVYSCPHGYHVVGLQSRLCRNGHWTGVDPVCTKNSKWLEITYCVSFLHVKSIHLTLDSILFVCLLI